MVGSSGRERLDPSQWWDTELPLQGARAADTVAQLVRLRRGMSPGRGADMLGHLATATGSGRRPVESATEDFITWNQAREMTAAGMTFGGHTDTHPVLASLAGQDQRAEFERGLDRIPTELDGKVTCHKGRATVFYEYQQNL